LNLVFLINLFGDTNVARIFYKSSQSCDTHTDDDNLLGTEGIPAASCCRIAEDYLCYQILLAGEDKCKMIWFLIFSNMVLGRQLTEELLQV
jgi:hypothetical protein